MPGGLVVALIPREGRDHMGGGMSQPGGGGAFEMRDVPPGDYDLILGSTGAGDDLYVSAVQMQDYDVLANGIHIGQQVLGPISVTLKANGGTVHANVADTDQKPVPDAFVRLVPDPPRRGQMALYADCKTDAQGVCTLQGVAPGTYHAFALTDDAPVDFRDPAAAKEIEDFGAGLNIAEGERTSIRLALVPAEK
jgi:hypothetical protein